MLDFEILRHLICQQNAKKRSCISPDSHFEDSPVALSDPAVACVALKILRDIREKKVDILHGAATISLHYGTCV